MVEAISDEGWKFEEWTGDVVSADKQITLLMDRDKALAANFVEVTLLVSILTFYHKNTKKYLKQLL